MKKTHVLFFDLDRSRFDKFNPGDADSEYFFHYIQNLEEGFASFKSKSDWNVLVMNASFLAQDEVYRWVKSCKDRSYSFRLIVLGHDGSKTEILRALRLEASDYLEAAVSEEDFKQSLRKIAQQGSGFQNKHLPMLESISVGGSHRPELRLVPNLPHEGTSGGSSESTAENTANVLGSESVRLSFTALKKRWAESFEKEYLSDLLSKMQGNVSAAAREAKLDRSNFLRLLRKHGLKAEVYRRPTLAA